MKNFNYPLLAALMALGSVGAHAQQRLSPRPPPATPRPAITTAPPPVVVVRPAPRQAPPTPPQRAPDSQSQQAATQ